MAAPQPSGPDTPWGYELAWQPTAPTRGLAGALVRLLPPVRRISDQRDRLLAERLDWRARNDVLHLLLKEERDRFADSWAELKRLRERAALAHDEPTEKLDYLFMLTYGRSGSTLLNGILNSIPGVLMRGENGAALTELWRFHRGIQHHRSRFHWNRPVSARHPFHGIDGYADDDALRLIRLLVVETLLRPYPDTRTVGFKEINWPDRDLDDFLQFLTDVFPGARFVVNVRDIDATATSGWWASDPAAREQLVARDAHYRAVAELLGDRAYLVSYDDYLADVGVLKGLFDWLGAPFDRDVVERVISIPHSYARRVQEEEQAEEQPSSDQGL